MLSFFNIDFCDNFDFVAKQLLVLKFVFLRRLVAMLLCSTVCLIFSVQQLQSTTGLWGFGQKTQAFA